MTFGLLSTLVLAPFLHGSGDIQTVRIPQPVITVAPRKLTEVETERLRSSALLAEVGVPNVGKFRFFNVEKRMIAIWDGFLLTERYALTTRALKRLGEIWQPGSVTPLEGETDLREWLSQSAPSDPRGKAPNDAPVFRLSVQSDVRLRSGDRTVLLLTSARDPLAAKDWPMPTSKSAPKAGDTEFLPGSVPEMTIDLASRYDSMESTRRLSLVSKVFEDWHKDQDKKMRSAVAAFFRKADTALKARFGGELPVGRGFGSLQPDTQKLFMDEAMIRFNVYGFESAEEAAKWLAGAEIVGVEARFYAAMPVYDPSGRSSLSYPIVLP